MILIWNGLKPDYSVSSNFSIREFMCKCGYCSYSIIDTNTIIICQAIRDLVGCGITIKSGYRCPGHNIRVGGKLLSRHIAGLAADLAWQGVSNDLKSEGFRDKIRDLQHTTQLMGIGWGSNFLHVDSDLSRKHLTEWTY